MKIDISKIQKKRFRYEDILNLCPDINYRQLYDILEELCESKQIAPIKKSGMTSFYPAVYQEYKKLSASVDYSCYLSEIAALNPGLNISGYLEKPGEYKELQEGICRLSEMLWKDDPRLRQRMSVKEKSFAIWGDEKYLESKSGSRILSFNRFDGDSLNFYYAPEPFFCRVFDQIEGDVIVIENKDTWYSIGEALKNGNHKRFLGVNAGLLVYGEGNKVTGEAALQTFVKEYGFENRKIFYAGDIDVAGILMYYGAATHNRDAQIQPFMPLYNKMAERAKNLRMQPTDDNRGRDWNHGFLDFFEDQNREIVRKVLDENRRIPQEILNLQDYLGMCE
ncbi:Wadjet anti-phage system protein JetD domain-containing protein [uncultured Robinsoniella sp.]|uniref:Wadjet anti-phage system protein JetD domain-containing protein n=1 Tax=uncultured Robinsoniella sp. TaxID=904190 RepID=UPI00374F50AE